MLIVCPACASEYEIEAAQVGLEGRPVRCAACRETWFVAPAPLRDSGRQEPAPPDFVARDFVVPGVIKPSFGIPRFDTPSFVAPDFAAPADGAVEWAAAGLVRPDGVAADVATAPSATASVIDHPTPPPRRAKGRPARGPDAAGRWRAAARRVRGRVPRPSAALALGLVVFVALPLALLGRSTLVRAMPRSAGLFAAAGLAVNLRGIDIRDVAAFREPAQGEAPGRLVVEGDLVGVARERVPVAALEIEIRDAAGAVLARFPAPAPRAALEPAETARFRASLTAPPAQGSRIEVRFAEAGR